MVGKDFKSGPDKESNIQREARLKKALPEFNKYSVTRPQKWSNMPHNLNSRQQKWSKIKKETLFSEIMRKSKEIKEPGPCNYKPKFKMTLPRSKNVTKSDTNQLNMVDDAIYYSK